MHCAKILIVEDEVIVADGIKNSLGKNGYRVASLAASGENAVLIAEKESPDLVLMDIVLKGELDGINAADQIHKKFGIPVIFLTAYSDNEIFQSAKITEPFGYITKPFDIKQLILNIEMALYKSEMEKEKEKLIHELQKEITERKEAEEALKESEEKYRRVIETVNETIVVAHEDMITFVNDKMVGMTGYSREEIESRPFLEFIYPDDQGMIAENYRRRLRGEALQSVYPFRFFDKNGTVRWAELSAALFSWEGKPATLNVITDITDRKLTQMKLLESEERYRLTTRATFDAVWDWNLVTNEVVWGEVIQSLFDYSPDEVGNDIEWWKEHIHPEDRERIVSGIHALIDSGGEIWSDEYSFLRGNGSYSIVHDRGYVVHDDKGKPVRMIGAMADITESKKAEEALRESEEKFRLAFDNANTGMCLVDLDGHLIKVNTMLCEISGYSTEELESMTVKDLTHPEDTHDYQEFAQNAISGEIESAHFEKRYIHKQGHILWCHVASSLVRDTNGNPLYFVSQVRDITANREMEQEIKELAKFPSEDPCPVLRVKKDGTILYANKASQPVLDIWGYRVGQVLTGNWLDAVMEVRGSGLHKEIEIEYHDRIYRLMFAFVAETDYVNVYGLEITDIKSAERQLLSVQQKLRSLARELSLTEDRERRRIAEFLHDEIGQMLVAILLKLCELKELEDSPKKTQLIDEIRDLLSQTIDNTRSATFELSPLILHELGFEPAIEWVCEKISEEHNLMIEFRNDSNPKLVKDDIGVFLFRAVRELLINVVKHSHATRAEVSILRKGDRVSIDVADNGIGFNKVKLNANLWGDMVFGIFNIQERIDSFDGTFEIVSEPGQGTRITLSVPMKSDDSSVKVGTP